MAWKEMLYHLFSSNLPQNMKVQENEDEICFCSDLKVPY
jgi:hypothetical protein